MYEPWKEQQYEGPHLLTAQDLENAKVSSHTEMAENMEAEQVPV